MAEDKNFDWLNSEVKKIWERLINLEQKADNIVSLDKYGQKLHTFEQILTNSPATFIQEAENASKQTSTYYNRAKKKCEELDENFLQIDSAITELNNKQIEISRLADSLKQSQEDILQKAPVIESEYENISNSLTTWQENSKRFSENYSASESWLKKAAEIGTKIQEIETECNGVLKKINSLHTQAIEKRDTIDELYDEIFGYEYDDDKTGEQKHENGLKDELIASYEAIKKQLKDYENSLNLFKKQKEEEYNSFISLKESDHNEIKKKIEGLLPNALTAGLSYAYADKAKKENDEYTHATLLFRTYIVLIALASCIPLLILAYMYSSMQLTFIEIMALAPKVSFSILPLYAPLVWR